MIPFRNILIHGYSTIDNRRAGRVIEQDLPRLEAEVSGSLDNEIPHRSARMQD